MNIRVLLFVVLVSGCHSLMAQTGNYFLSNYTPSDERIDYLTFNMTQDDKGVIYFANKSGVLQFDGRNWTLIPTPGPIYTVTSKGSDIFAAGSNGYGKLTWGGDTQSFVSLSDDQPEASQILSCLTSADDAYFLSEHALYVYSMTTGKTALVIKAQPQQVFSGLYKVSDSVYVETQKEGLLKLDKGKLIPSSIGLPGHLSVVFCSLLKDGNKVLIGSDSGRLFVHDEKGLKEIAIKDRSFMENNLMIDGVWVTNDLIAIGTIRRGVVFIDPNTGDTQEVINYHTGLPDNEVYSMLCDRNQGVWVAHDYGFTRIAPNLPFRSYNHYPGLSGNLLCAHGFKGRLYVGTTVGLFALEKEELYEEEIVVPVTQEKVIPESPPKPKKGLLSFLKKETKPAKKQVVQAPPKAKRVLKSVQFVFKRVEGVEGNVSQLIEADKKLLAGGIGGVLEVEDLKSKAIVREPVRSIFLSPSLNQLLVSTFEEEMMSFAANQKGEWTETHLLDTLVEPINYIFEDKLQNIWLCSKANVFKVEVVDGAISDIASIPFSNPTMDEPVGVAWGSEVYLAASGFFNRFDITQNKFVRFNNNKLPVAKKYFASAGYFWFYDGHRWRNVDEALQKTLKLEWLGLFPNIRYLSPTGNGDGLWVITGSNELYNFSINRAAVVQTRYPLFLREVRAQTNKIAPASSLTISQLESAVTFEFIQPDFLGMKAIEYRYRVSGISKDWSPWSANNNIVNFSYLPTGEYKVEVQTHDLMTTVAESDQIDQVQQVVLVVEPPYWKRSWFYAIEFAFFSFLVFISLRLSSANSKYRYISRLLSVLTVIMLIQFIQTVVASQISFTSTPVIDFFIQVFIALLVLPIEGYLRKFMIRSVEGRLETTRLWDEKQKP